MKFFNKEQLEKINTKRLLAYRNSLLRFRDEPDWDCIVGDSKKFTKQSPEWQEAYRVLKEVLATREHVGSP